jgi:CDP-glucose 4,6-dehydratase
LLLASKMHEDPEIFSGPWNFGPDPDSIITVKEVVEKVLKYYGKGTWIRTNNIDEFHESNLLNLDTSKARYLLGWIPKFSLEEGLKNTILWYKNPNNQKIISNIK